MSSSESLTRVPEPGHHATQKIHQVLAGILRLMVQPLPFEELLGGVLDLMFSLPWLGVQAQGSIFLVADRSDQLVLAAQRNLHPALLEKCALVPFGSCVCGRAAASRELLHVDCVNHLHDHRIPDMPPHGHVCVPIQFPDRLIGVLNLYLAEHQPLSAENREFLHAVADTLAGVIVRRRTQASLVKDEEVLRQIVLGTSASTGREFFRKLVLHLAAALEVRCALVAELPDTDAGGRLRILASWDHDEPLADPEHDLAGSLWQDILRDGAIVYRDGVAQRFPDNPRLSAMGAQSFAGVAMRDAAGSVIGVISVMDDRPMPDGERVQRILQIFGVRAGVEIERLRAERALHDSEMRFRTLVESVNDWVWEVDTSGVYTYASPRVQQLLGYRPEEVIGRTPFDLMPAEEAKRIARIFSGIAARREPFTRLENTNLHKDGRELVLETSGMPIFDADGTFLGYRGIDRDVTDRKRAEERFRAMVDLAPDAMLMVDDKGQIVLFNRCAEAMFGYSRHEVLGQHVEMLVPESRRLRHVEHRAGFMRAPASRPMGSRRYIHGLHKCGSSIPVDISLSPLETEHGRMVTAVIRDVSGATREEEEMASVASLAEHSPIPIIEMSTDLEPTYVNAAAALAFPELVSSGQRHPVFAGLADRIDRLVEGEVLTRAVTVNGVQYEQRVLFLPILNTLRVYCWSVPADRGRVPEQAGIAVADRAGLDRAVRKALFDSRNRQETQILVSIQHLGIAAVLEKCGPAAAQGFDEMVSGVMARHAQQGDTPAALGGGRHVLLLPGCTVPRAVRIADSIVSSIRALRFVWEYQVFSLDAVRNVMVIDGQYRHPQEVLEAADTAIGRKGP